MINTMLSLAPLPTGQMWGLKLQPFKYMIDSSGNQFPSSKAHFINSGMFESG